MPPAAAALWRLGAALAILLSAMLPLPCPAADVQLDPNIQFDTFFGYDNIVPEVTWFPVVCEVKNDGPSFTAVIQIGVEADNELMVNCPVELPTGTTKRVVIPVFPQSSYARSWVIRLRDKAGHLHVERTIEPRKSLKRGTPLIGGLAREAGGTPILRPLAQSSQNQEMQPASARFQTPIFPDNPLTLEGLDALYLNSQKAGELKPAQANAILAWVHAGGHLIVGVEQIDDITAAPWLKDLMPCDLGETVKVNRHPEVEDWLRTPGQTALPRARFLPGRRAAINAPPGVNPRPSPYQPTRPQAGSPPVQTPPAPQLESPATYGDQPTPDNPFANVGDDATFELAEMEVFKATPAPDGRVMLAAGDVPLIIAAPRGMGRITVLPFSPEREPFRSWRNLPTFWSKLAGVPGEMYLASANNNYYGGYMQSGTDGIFGAMIDSRQVHKLPAGWLLLLLVVYLVVIGPLDQYWLKRIGRPMLTWVTFPCYVAFFSLLIYFIGYKLRAGDSEWNEFHVVDVLQHGQRAEMRGQTFASLYSPANQTYPVKGQDKFSTIRGEYAAGYMGMSRSTERLDVTQMGDSFAAELYVPVWTSQMFVNDWWHADTMPFEVKVVARDGGWLVTVNNHTERTLRTARLVMNGMLYDLGECPASQERSFTIAADRGHQLTEFVMARSAVFQNVVRSRQSALGSSSSGQITDLADASMAASFVSLLDHESPNRTFVGPPGLDITRTVQDGTPVFLAFAEDYSPVNPITEFKSLRSHHYTLWRMPVAVETQ
jgi:hypothetical protein